MPANPHHTRERILQAALELFSRQGIGKTSLADVARRSGASRVTIYRYFPDKQALAGEVFILGDQAFRRGLEELRQRTDVTPEQVIRVIGEGLASLPPHDPTASVDELRRLYPEAYRRFQSVRTATLDALFDGLFELAGRQGTLRPGLDRRLVEAVFAEVVVGFFDRPAFRTLGMSGLELYEAVSHLLLYGLLRTDGRSPSAPRVRSPARGGRRPKRKRER
jgi:AcrR family transcriptional regulator